MRSTAARHATWRWASSGASIVSMSGTGRAGAGPRGIRARLPMPGRTCRRHRRAPAPRVVGVQLVILAATVEPRSGSHRNFDVLVDCQFVGAPSSLRARSAAGDSVANGKILSDARGLPAVLRDAARLSARPLGDALRADADRLRGDIQRELLASLAVDSPPINPTP